MHLSVERYLFNDRCSVGFQRTPVIVNRHACYFTDNPIRDDRRDTACQEFILPFFPPTADQVVTFIEFFKESRYIDRIVLQIAVHTDDPFTAREFKTCRHRCRLSSILFKSDDDQSRFLFTQFRKHIESFVFASIVDE